MADEHELPRQETNTVLALLQPSDLPDVGDEPNQPRCYSFPKRSFGKKSVVYRSFQAAWFDRWRWLHYDCSRDLAFCFTCIKAIKTGKMKLAGNAKDSSFIFNGFHSWKEAIRCLNTHEQTSTHKRAVEMLITIPETTHDVGEMLSLSLAAKKNANRQVLLKIAQNILFLAKQGIPLRGDGTEIDSNFMQLLKLRSIDDPQIDSFIEQKRDKYCSPQIQNEILKVMALHIVRDIAKSVQQAKFFTIMADEVTDCSNKDQVAICFRTVDDNFEPQESFIGLHVVESIQADVLVEVLKDTMVRMNLSINNCRGQCYDGAANMCGSRNGVATQIASEEPRATFVHCYGHALNLAAGDTVKKNKVLRNTLDTTLEISKLLKFSPRRDAMFNALKSQTSPETPGFRTLCPTRWTVRGCSLESILENYSVFEMLWEEVRETSTDSETRARVTGVQATMETFEYLFGLTLGQRIFKHTDNLSRTIQNPSLTAFEAQDLAKKTIQTLQRIRNEESYDLFWERMLILKRDKKVNDPVLPRKRRAPVRIEVGSSKGYHPVTPKDLYRQHYFECLDLIINHIKGRNIFDQPGFAVLRNLEDLLLKAAWNENYATELEFVLDMYKDDFDVSNLKTQLELLYTSFSSLEKRPTLLEVRDHFTAMSLAQRGFMSEICILLKLILVIPATNAVSERSASALRRVKTYLRSTMTQVRLNNLLILHVHKQMATNLDILNL